MGMKRREFLIGGALGSTLGAPQETLEVDVMEVFSSTGPSAHSSCRRGNARNLRKLASEQQRQTNHL